MNKKIIWGTIALVAVLVIVGVIFVVDQEEPPVQEDPEMENIEIEEEDLLWDVEDHLFYAYDAIYNLEDASEEERESLFERYDDLEERLWDLEELHFDEELDEGEFESELQILLEDIKSFLQEIE